MRLPDFVIIGAMKCGTSTLHDQLVRQSGLFMSDPKELYFFSNDEVYAKGLQWYASHFADAPTHALCGESSTHYTKLPTYPHTVERLQQHLPDAKFIYVMRHPIDRLISQFVHEWSERAVPDDIEQAVHDFPHFTAYSRYAYQLKPFIDNYGWTNVLPVFFDRLVDERQAELERVCSFLDYPGQPHWFVNDDHRNVSDARLRKSLLRDGIVWNSVVTWARRRFIPQAWRDQIKRLWQMNKRPELSPATCTHLETIIDEDLKTLGGWLGVELTCANFKAITASKPLEFRARTTEVHA